MSGSQELKKYQLQWRPTFPYSPAGQTGVRMYVIGEKSIYTGQDYQNLSRFDEPSAASQADQTRQRGATSGVPQSTSIGISTNPSNTSLNDLVELGSNTTLILPFNNSVALAEEYTPRYKNKVIEYESLGGNSVTTFGQGIKKIGLKIRIIRAGRNWEIYQKGVEAISYLSGNQSRYPGSLYLIGYDQFADGTESVSGRYKVIVNTLDYAYRSSENTSVHAMLEMTVLHDYGHKKSAKNRKWGAL